MVHGSEVAGVFERGHNHVMELVDTETGFCK